MEIPFDTGKWFTLSEDAYWLLNALVYGGTAVDENLKGVPTRKILSLDGYGIIVIFVGFLIVAGAVCKRKRVKGTIGGSRGPRTITMNSLARDPVSHPSDNNSSDIHDNRIFSWDGESQGSDNFDNFVHSTDVGSDLLSEDEARVLLHHLYVQRQCEDLLIPSSGCLETIEEEGNFASLSPPNSESGFDSERNGDWTTEKFENDPDRITVVEMDAVIQPLSLQNHEEIQVSYEYKEDNSLSRDDNNRKCQEFYDNNMNVEDIKPFRTNKFLNHEEELVKEVKYVNDIELYNDYEIVEKTILEGLCDPNFVDLLEPLGLLNQHQHSIPVNEMNGINSSDASCGFERTGGKLVSDPMLLSCQPEGSPRDKSIIGCQGNAQAQFGLSVQVESEQSLSWQVNRATPANHTGNLLIQSEERVEDIVNFAPSEKDDGTLLPKDSSAIDPNMDNFKQLDIDKPRAANDGETVLNAIEVNSAAAADENEGINSTHAIDARLRNLLKRSEERQTRTECLLNVLATTTSKDNTSALKQKEDPSKALEGTPSTEGINDRPQSSTSFEYNSSERVVDEKFSTSTDFVTPTTTDDEEKLEKEENKFLPSESDKRERGPTSLVGGGKLKLAREVITATKKQISPRYSRRESSDENTLREISRNSEVLLNGRDCESGFLEEDPLHYQQKQKTCVDPSALNITNVATTSINFETFSKFLLRGAKEFGDLKQTSSDQRLTKKSFPDLPVSYEPVSLSSDSFKSTPSLYRSSSDPQLSSSVYAEFQGSLSFDESNSETYSRLYKEPFSKLLSTEEDKNVIDRTAATSTPKDVTKKITASPGKSKYSTFSSLKLAGREDTNFDMEVQSPATSPNNKGIISVHVRELEIRPTSPCSPFLARTCETLQLSPPSRPPRKRSESGSSDGRHPILRSPSRSPMSSSPARNVSFESTSSGTGSIKESSSPSPVSNKPIIPKKPILSNSYISNGSNKYEEVVPVFGVKPPVPPNKPVHLNLNGHPRKPFVYKPLSIAPTKINPEELKEKITGYEAATHAKPAMMNGKPPLPPLPSSRIGLGVKGRVASARKQYFEKNGKSSNSRSESPASVVHDRLKQFCAETQEERVRLATSTPDVLAEVENSMRGSRSIDRAPVEDKSASPGEGIGLRTSPYRRKEKREAEIAWPSYRQKPHEGSGRDPERDLRRRSKSLGFLETDIDTFQSREVLETDLDEAVARVAYEIAGLLHQQRERVERASSMLTINDKRGTAARKDEETNGVLPEDRAKSMDFLLDDDNRAAIIPPENSLRQNQAAGENGKNGKSKSEHEIRFERSLQNLTLPEWYKQSDWSKKPKEGFLLKRENEKRWDGFRTPSCTSLTSVGSVTNASTRSVIIPKRVTRPDWRYVSSLRSSRDSIPSSAESASPRDAASFQYGVSAASDPLSRWSSSRLSTSSTPANSSWSLYRSYRQPYLGWRHAVASSQGAQTPCSSRSGAPSPSPSPAPSTPQTGSRPVSPGRSPGDLSFQQPPWAFPKYWMPGDPHKPKDIPESDSDAPVAPHRRRRKSRDRSREDLSPDDLKNDPGNLRRGFAPPDEEYAGNSAGSKMSRDRYSYIQSIYNSDPKLERLKGSCASPANEDDSVATDGSLKSPLSSSSASPQVFWMESSFVGSRTTSVVLLPDGKSEDERQAGSPIENGQGNANQRSPSVNCGELSRSSTSERLVPGRGGDGDSATSMEEVLDSLLAIPCTSRSASPLISRRESPVQIKTAPDTTTSPDKKTKSSSPSHEKTVTFKEPHSETLHYDSDDLALFPPPASPSPPPAPPSPPIPLPPMYRNYYPASSAHPLPPPPHLSEPVDALRTPTLPATPPPTPVTQESTEGSFTDLPVCRSSQNAPQEKVADERLTSPVIEKDEQGFIRLNMDDSTPEKEKDKRKSKKDPGKDFEDGPEGPGDLRQGSIRNASTIRCRRPNCKRSLPTEEARVKFRTCSNCYTFYCSRQCRKAHYERHKSQCPRTRISNLCTQVLMKVREDPCSRRHLSICATRGLLSRGRGVVKLVFLNAEDALDYLCNGWESLKGQTFYVPRTELMPQEMGPEVFGQVRILCDKYNTDRKFILLAAISVMSEVQTNTPEGLVTVNIEREVVVRGVKMRLAPPLPEDEVQTLICTVTNDPPIDGKMDVSSEDLQKGLDVINSQMEERGVNLSESYPEVYAKIIKFVDKKEPFVPFNIFPVDKRNGKMFMCILLPWADGEIIKKISSKTTASRSRRKWII